MILHVPLDPRQNPALAYPRQLQQQRAEQIAANKRARRRRNLARRQVFENFRDTCHAAYEIDPAHHYTLAHSVLPSSNRHVWPVKISNQLEKSRFIILSFQTKKKRKR